MRLRPGLVAAAIAAAAAAHLLAAFLLRGAPLVGSGGFTRAVSGAAGGPCPSGDDAREPLRVSLGAAEWTPSRAPGPRPALDPDALRRPPRAGVEWDGHPDLRARLAACAAAISTKPDEARDAPRVRPPGLGRPFAAEGPGPSSVDLAAGRDAVAVGVTAATRALPSRFAPGPGPAPSLAHAAGAARPSLATGDVRLDFPFERLPPEPPAGWPAPDRALFCPEICVDLVNLAPPGQ